MDNGWQGQRKHGSVRRVMEEQRIFFALPLPPELKEHLASIRDRATSQLGAEVLRPVKTENFHLTLQFLGNQAPSAVETARKVLEHFAEATRIAPSVAVAGLGAFPKPQSPRVIWAGIHDLENRAATIASDLGVMLSDAAFSLDTKPFRPHVTLAYVRKGVGRLGQRRIQRWLDSAGESNPDPTSNPVRVLNRLVLYRSELARGGSVYTEIDSVEFSVHQ